MGCLVTCMWRVAWNDGGQTSQWVDYPKRRQARKHAEMLRALRGARVGCELVYWVRVWA